MHGVSSSTQYCGDVHLATKLPASPYQDLPVLLVASSAADVDAGVSDVQVLNDPLQLAFSAVVPDGSYEAGSSKPAATGGLPLNVHLLTARWLSCTTILVRLSHMFQAGEHPSLSQPATVKLEALAKLLKLQVTKVQEAALFGERALTNSDERRPQYNISEVLTTWQPPLLLPSSALSFTSNRVVGPIPIGTSITLNPMQIRAFYFTAARHSSCSDPPLGTPSLAGATLLPAAEKVNSSVRVSLLVRQVSNIESIAHVASLPQSVLLLLLLVPTGVAVGIAFCLVGRSYLLKFTAAGTKSDRLKGIARSEYVNL